MFRSFGDDEALQYGLEGVSIRQLVERKSRPTAG
jgi:hypothetical protein